MKLEREGIHEKRVRIRNHRIRLAVGSVGLMMLVLVSVQPVRRAIGRGLRAWLPLKEIYWVEVGKSNTSFKLNEIFLRQQAKIEKGEGLFSLNLNEIEMRLKEIPWIKEVHLRKKIPYSLEVQYQTYSVRALTQIAGKLWLVSTEGIPIITYAPSTVEGLALDLPWIQQSSQAELPQALKWIDAMERFLGDFGIRIHEVRVTEAGTVILFDTKNLHHVQLIGPHEPNLERMRQAMLVIVNKKLSPKWIDLRLDKKIVVNLMERP